MELRSLKQSILKRAFISEHHQHDLLNLYFLRPYISLYNDATVTLIQCIRVPDSASNTIAFQSVNFSSYQASIHSLWHQTQSIFSLFQMPMIHQLFNRSGNIFLSLSQSPRHITSSQRPISHLRSKMTLQPTSHSLIS